MTVSPAALLALTGLALLSAWRVMGEREPEPSATQQQQQHQALLAALAVTGSLATMFALAWTPFLSQLSLGDAGGDNWLGAAALLGFALPVGGGLAYAVRRSSLASSTMATGGRTSPAITESGSRRADAASASDAERREEPAANRGPGEHAEAPDSEASQRADPDAPTTASAERETPVLSVPEPRPVAHVEGEPVPVEEAYARAAELLDTACAAAFSGHASGENNERLAGIATVRGWEHFVVSGGPHDAEAETATGGNAKHEQELALMIAGGGFQGVLFLDARGEFSPLVVNSLTGMGSVCLYEHGTPVSQASRVQLRFETEADRRAHLRGIARAMGFAIPGDEADDDADETAPSGWTRPLRAGRPSTRRRSDPRDPRPERRQQRRARR